MHMPAPPHFQHFSTHSRQQARAHNSDSSVRPQMVTLEGVVFVCMRVCVCVCVYIVPPLSQPTAVSVACNNSKRLLQHKGTVKVGGDDRRKQLHHIFHFLKVHFSMLRAAGVGGRGVYGMPMHITASGSHLKTYRLWLQLRPTHHTAMPHPPPKCELSECFDPPV